MARNETTVPARPLTQVCMQRWSKQKLYSGWVLVVIIALIFGVDSAALICPMVANLDTAHTDQSSRREVLVSSILTSAVMAKWTQKPGLERMMGRSTARKSSPLHTISHGSGRVTVMAQNSCQKTTSTLSLTTLCHHSEVKLTTFLFGWFYWWNL
jgi:hypothetical protein